MGHSSTSDEGWSAFESACQALLKRLHSFGDYAGIVLLIDEVSAISKWNNAVKVLTKWRSLMQDMNGYNFIVGSAYPLYQFTKNEWSPFFNIFRPFELKELSELEARQLIIRPAESVGISYTRDSISEIIALTGCKPYYVQVLCTCVF